MTSGGALTVRSRANSNAGARADGSGVITGDGTTVGAAVALDRSIADNQALIHDANATGASATVDAALAARKIDIDNAQGPSVDLKANTIYIGVDAAAKFATGDEVSYDNGGGTSIGGLTSDGGTTKYHVIVGEEGKIKLATSAENATAGTAVDLTSLGAGDTHKIDSSDDSKDATFDPDKRPDLKVVDLDANTIYVGAEKAAQLGTGTEVSYDNGGGTSIDGLTDDNGTTKYYTIDAGGGKIKLADSISNANAGIEVNLKSLGTGSSHKIDATVGTDGDVTFDPSQTRFELKLAAPTTLVTGEAVTYDKGDAGNTAIGGLTDDTVYFVVNDGSGDLKLAETREKALQGEVIEFTSVGTGSGHSLSESTHGSGAAAVAGASGGKIGVAGSFVRQLGQRPDRRTPGRRCRRQHDGRW